VKVLVVEDNQVSARLLQAHLEKEGNEPIVASSASEALKILDEDPEIRLVITDISMPEVDGFEFISAIRSKPNLAGLPVIVISAHADMANVVRAAKLGCRHYLIKPVTRVQLRKRLREIFGEEKPPISDRGEVMRKLDLDEAAYRELGESFAKLLETHAKSLREGNGKGEAGASQLSELMESAEIFGATRLLELLRASSDGKPREKSLQPPPAELLAELRRVQQALAEALAEKPAEKKDQEQGKPKEEAKEDEKKSSPQVKRRRPRKASPKSRPSLPPRSPHRLPEHLDQTLDCLKLAPPVLSAHLRLQRILLLV
jgi:Response regulator containing a CheY-like receiver domain and a GGDEF domain